MRDTGSQGDDRCRASVLHLEDEVDVLGLEGAGLLLDVVREDYVAEASSLQKIRNLKNINLTSEHHL